VTGTSYYLITYLFIIWTEVSATLGDIGDSLICKTDLFCEQFYVRNESMINVFHFETTILLQTVRKFLVCEYVPIMEKTFTSGTGESCYRYKQYVVKHTSLNDFIRVYCLHCCFHVVGQNNVRNTA